MRRFIACLSAAVLTGVCAPAFAGGIAANHAGFAVMHSAAAALGHKKPHHHRHHPHGFRHHVKRPAGLVR